MKSKLGYAMMLLLSVVAAARLLLPQAHPLWPEMETVRRTFRFSDVEQATVSLYLRNPHGMPVYWFGCHSADFAGKPSDPFHDDAWNYYGEFDCHLHALSDKNGFNLLSYSATDHLENFSRAVTFSEELEGRCADYPDWGRVRIIRVRGMLVTLKFSDLGYGQDFDTSGNRKLKGGAMRSFRFDVQIVNDEGARSPFAEFPKFANPLFTPPGSTKNISDNCAKLVPEHSTR